jgi:hypothetical protein
MTKPNLIDTLELQRAALTKKIKAEKEKQRRKSRLAQDKQHALIGKIIIEAAENDTDLKRTIDTLLHAKLTRKTDRNLFNLPPLPSNTGNNQDEKTG